jgi:two-component system, chemotaxis family, chemotaxis protein CheY
MMIHDTPAMKAIVAAILRGANFRNLRYSESPDDMMEAMVAKPPDIIICDYNRRTADNIALLTRIRACEPDGIQLLPVVFIARYTEEAVITAARDAGATEIVARPLSAKSLLSRIDNIIRNPRDFVRCKTYFGPCRRRRTMPFSGADRRVG